MGKQVLGVIVGLIVWFAAAVVAGVLLRSLWPEYVAASGDAILAVKRGDTLATDPMVTLFADANSTVLAPRGRT